MINNRVTDFIPNPTFERVAAPGAHEKFFAGENTEGLTLREMQGKAIEAPAATRNPDDRVAELDRQGVVEALNYPTLASLVEHSDRRRPQLTLAIIHALNVWMVEHWSFNYEDRIFSTPIINLSEVDAAQRELEYILDNGAKVALIKPGPVNGLHGWRSPALPEFDPFWRDVESAGLPIVLHASYPPLDDYVGKWEPPHTANFMAQSAFRWMVLGHREIADMITSADLPRHADPFPEAAHRQRRERQLAGSTRCSTTSPTSTRRCRRTSPSIRTTCSAATSGSARSGRAASPTSSTPSAGTRCCSARTTRIPRGWPSRRASGSTPRAWTCAAPTTSWATTPAGSWACRSPTPIRPRPSRPHSPTFNRTYRRFAGMLDPCPPSPLATASTSSSRIGARVSRSCSIIADHSRPTTTTTRCCSSCAKVYGVVAHRRRGHGRAFLRGNSGRDIDRYAADGLGAVFEHWAWNNSVHIGHSTASAGSRTTSAKLGEPHGRVGKSSADRRRRTTNNGQNRQNPAACRSRSSTAWERSARRQKITRITSI